MIFSQMWKNGNNKAAFASMNQGSVRIVLTNIVYKYLELTRILVAAKVSKSIFSEILGTYNNKTSYKEILVITITAKTFYNKIKGTPTFKKITDSLWYLISGYNKFTFNNLF